MFPGSTQVDSVYRPEGVTSLLVETTRQGAMSCKRPPISIPRAGPERTYSRSSKGIPVHSATRLRTSSSLSPIP